MRITIFSMLLIAFGATCLVADEAEYRLTFDGGWSLPPLPGGAHFSPLIGATHSSPDQIFYVGGFATPGVEQVAETGVTTVLTNEINQLIQTGDVGTRIFRPGNIGPVSDVTVDFVADSENSLMTMLTMIAPSPDWFVGVNSFDLRDGSGWIDEAVLVLNSYDAGTEEGDTYSLSNAATSPHSSIEMLDAVEPDNPLFGFGSVATLTITRTDVSLFAVGDVNRDGAVDLLDVAPFVAVLNAGAFTTESDINCDGSVTLLDVQPFVELLSNN